MNIDMKEQWHANKSKNNNIHLLDITLLCLLHVLFQI